MAVEIGTTAVLFINYYFLCAPVLYFYVAYPATLLVPEQSDIMTAKSKNGQEIVYRSTSKPIRPAEMKLAVLVNKGYC